jgi:hypothetical protein
LGISAFLREWDAGIAQQVLRLPNFCEIEQPSNQQSLLGRGLRLLLLLLFFLSKDSDQLLDRILLLLRLLRRALLLLILLLLRLLPEQVAKQSRDGASRIIEIGHQPFQLHLGHLLHVRREPRIGKCAGYQSRDH